MNDLVKQDINFLENPLWMQNIEQNEKGFSCKDKEGYLYKSAGKAPTRVDAIFLYYLLQRAQQNNWSPYLELSRYQIIKACGFTDSQKSYTRLMDSMERWWSVGVGFKGTFYNNKKYETLLFNIIDDVELEEGKGAKLKIKFSEKWLCKIRESSYYKLIDFEQMKSLKTPLASRLYEILSKTFKGRNVWKIDAHKLANKIPMNEKYLSHIIAQLKPAINRISRNTELTVTMDIRKTGTGKAVFTFRKITPEDIAKQQARKKLNELRKTLNKPKASSS